MQTAKLFNDGENQAVHLPKEYRFAGEEVGIKKEGNTVVLFPKDDAWEAFLKCEPVTDDFVEAILEARKDQYQSPREPL